MREHAFSTITPSGSSIHITSRLYRDYTDTDTSLLYITPAFFEWANNRAPKTTTTKVK